MIQIYSNSYWKWVYRLKKVKEWVIAIVCVGSLAYLSMHIILWVKLGAK